MDDILGWDLKLNFHLNISYVGIFLIRARSFAPRWFVVPFAFSSLGCLASSTEEVMKAMAARHAASEAAGGAASAGHGILHASEVATAAVGGYRARGVGAAAAAFADGSGGAG